MVRRTQIHNCLICSKHREEGSISEEWIRENKYFHIFHAPGRDQENNVYLGHLM